MKLRFKLCANVSCDSCSSLSSVVSFPSWSCSSLSLISALNVLWVVVVVDFCQGSILASMSCLLIAFDGCVVALVLWVFGGGDVVVLRAHFCVVYWRAQQGAQ